MNGIGAGGSVATLPERLKLFLHRYQLPEEAVCAELGWNLQQLQEYLVSDSKKNHKPVPRQDRAVQEWISNCALRIALKNGRTAASSCLVPVSSSLRITSSLRRATLTHSYENSLVQCVNTQQSAHRKRRRGVDQQSVLECALASRQQQPSITSCVRPLERLIPIRLDVDIDGVRFQDTFYVNILDCTFSPEEMAAQLAHDEKLSEDVKDAVAESVRRQVISFRSFDDDLFVHSERESIHPIVLDVVINDIVFHDQLEWDITRESTEIVAFVKSLCRDLELSEVFENAIVFSMLEQVHAYRCAVYAPWTCLPHDPSCTALVPVVPPHQVDQMLRPEKETAYWQPVLSQLSTEEKVYLDNQWRAHKASHSVKIPQAPPASSRRSGTIRRNTVKSHKNPRNAVSVRPINPFLMFCQVQRDHFKQKSRRISAAEMRKVMGDQWRKCSDEDKERYAQLADVENEKRRREALLDQRDQVIGEWEEEEAKRKGFLSSNLALMDMHVSLEHCRGLLLEDYIRERHEVDSTREDKRNAENA